MAFCPRCGVQTHEKTCALCSTPIPPIPDLPWQPPAWPRTSPEDPSMVYPTFLQRRNQAFALVTSIILLAGMILLAVDVYQDWKLDWSLVPLIALGSAELYVYFIFFFYRSFLWITGGILGTTALFLFLIDAADTGQWFLTLGLPIVSTLALLMIPTYFIIRKSRRHGFNVPGFLLAGCGLFCLSLDALITHQLTGQWLLTWSIIVTLAILPMGAYFFYLHYALRREVNIKRTLHL